MNLEKFTDRAKGFLQSAQTVAIRMNHQRITPEHLLKALLEDNEGMSAQLIQRAGGNAKLAVDEVDAALAKVPAVSGSGAQATPGLDNDAVRALDQAEQAGDQGGRQLRAGAAHPAGARAAIRHRRGQGAQGGQCRRQGARSGDPGVAPAAALPTVRGAEECLRRDEEVRPRPDPGRARRQARPGDRPRRGNPPHDPDPRPADQEQSRADRRTRHRQDRHRRRPRAAHRQWRRARQPQGPRADGARHGQPDRRGEVSRRVRGTAQGRARRGQGRRGAHHPVHRRDAHADRRRRVAKAAWMPATCSSPRWRAASCTASARPRSTNTRSTSRRTPRCSAASSRCSSPSRPSRTPSAILRGLKEKYELHHGVRITDGAIVAAAQLSNRYITDRFLPDKAIDLMDEAASRIRMEVESKPEEIEDLDRRIIQLKIEEQALGKESDKASQGPPRRPARRAGQPRTAIERADHPLAERTRQDRMPRARSRKSSTPRGSSSNRRSAPAISPRRASCNTAAFPNSKRQLAAAAGEARKTPCCARK